MPEVYPDPSRAEDSAQTLLEAPLRRPRRTDRTAPADPPSTGGGPVAALRDMVEGGVSRRGLRSTVASLSGSRPMISLRCSSLSSVHSPISSRVRPQPKQ